MKNAIQEQIEGIQKYFIYKASIGEYSIVKSNEYFVTIKIDDTYQFNIWVGNGSKYCCFYKYSVDDEHFMSLPELGITERLMIWENLESKLNVENKTDVSIQELIEQHNNSI
jgi:hypothetical protein